MVYWSRQQWELWDPSYINILNFRLFVRHFGGLLRLIGFLSLTIQVRLGIVVPGVLGVDESAVLKKVVVELLIDWYYGTLQKMLFWKELPPVGFEKTLELLGPINLLH